MSRNGSGTFSPSVDFTTEAGSPPIEISKLDTAIDDLGDEITNSIAADGQTNPTANLPMNGKRHTNVDNAAARTDYASAQDVQDQDLIFGTDTGAADAYVLTAAPAITAYEEGQRFVFKAANSNTGASTLAVNGLTARAIQTPDANPLESGMIVAGIVYEVTAVGSGFIMTSPPSAIPSSMLGTVAVAQGGTGSTSASDARTALGVAIGSDVQAYSAALDELSTIGTPGESNQFIVSNALDWERQGASTARTSLGVEIGSDVQAWDTQLDDIAALAVTDGNIIVGNGTNWVAESGATARTSLGLGTGDSPQFTGINVGNASDTTITRDAAGQIAVEGDAVFTHDNGSYTSAKITYSTSDPSGGSSGDLWFKYDP